MAGVQPLSLQELHPLLRHAAAVEALLQSVLPDSNLCRVRVRVRMDGTTQVFVIVGREIAFTRDDGVPMVDGEWGYWNDLTATELPAYLAWLEAGNVGMPRMWDAMQNADARVLPKREMNPSFGLNNGPG
jgi:hypothetical protein